MLEILKAKIRPFFARDFSKLYKEIKDPWHYNTSAYEKERFKEIIRLAKTVPYKNILEIGSAEGHLTKSLTDISGNVTCLEISKDAISRAKQKAPKAKYINISFQNFDSRGQKFDLIVCSEVLYYFKNKRAAIFKMENMADFILLSNFGLWDILFSFYFKKMALLKKSYVSSPKELKFAILSLWGKIKTDD